MIIRNTQKYDYFHPVRNDSPVDNRDGSPVETNVYLSFLHAVGMHPLVKLLIIFCCALCSICTTQAQHKTAKAWLDKSSSAFTAAGTLSADFSMTVKMPAQKVSHTFDGTIDIKGTKYHLNVPDVETWFDGKTQWVLQKDYNEVNVSEPNAQEVQQLNPAFLFALYKKGCSYNYLGEKTEKGRKVHEVELIPQNKKSDLSKIVLQISAVDAMPTNMHLFYRNKTENSIHINKYRKHLTLPDSFFRFDPKKHPKVDVIDLI
ncbi:MAG: outer-membrane lipoprotein carrier protein LolA [Candidatus Symbiothrix sp.]|jgi:outer membrane lipoprotein-sorting protein|nr:outer-membrane lipoprotein carrier protein LolA [Candidatus Symbiothrix sp.]